MVHYTELILNIKDTADSFIMGLYCNDKSYMFTNGSNAISMLIIFTMSFLSLSAQLPETPAP